MHTHIYTHTHIKAILKTKPKLNNQEESKKISRHICIHEHTHTQEQNQPLQQYLTTYNAYKIK